MNAQDIIQAIREEGADSKQAIIDALCDGAALLALGITDKDQAAVEEAFAIVQAAAE